MMRKYIIKIAPFLCGICIITCGFLLWNNHKWKEELSFMAQYAGTLESLNDYNKGILRIYEVKYGGQHEFSGEKDGPFEIWYKPCYSIIGKPHMHSIKTFVSAYNSKMKYMYRHPEKFPLSINDGSE